MTLVLESFLEGTHYNPINCANCIYAEKHGREFFGIETLSCNAKDTHLGSLSTLKLGMKELNPAEDCIYFERRDTQIS